MRPCQACRSPKRQLYELECGHVCCEQCFSEIEPVKPAYETIHVSCKWKSLTRPDFTCTEVSDWHKVLNEGRLEPEFDPEQEKLIAERRAKDLEELERIFEENSDPANFMEPELVAVAKEMGTLPKRRSRRGGRRDTSEEQSTSKRTRCDQATEGGESSNMDTEEEEDTELTNTYYTLTEHVNKCAQIQGFCEEGDKIVLDIAKGTQVEVTNFIKGIFPKTDTAEKYFNYVEQEGSTKFLVATGAKLALEAPFTALVTAGAHPDKLQGPPGSIATVTCLGVDDQHNLYILTAKHSFGDEVSTVNDPFISCYRSQLKRVSEVCSGFFGSWAPISAQRSPPQFIDIAALRVNDEIKNSLFNECPQLLKELNPIYAEKNYHKSMSDLNNRVVYKTGATSGTTAGRIVKANYYVHNAPINGHCFLVESLDPNQPFAIEGDSGALIWDDNSIPLGIVSFQRAGFVWQGRNINMTFAVRLDYCIEALFSKANIDIQICKAVGSPLPVHPEPSSELEGVDVN